MAGQAIEVKEASAPEKRSYRTVHHVEVHRVKGPNGGFKVLHHFNQSGISYHEPQEHLFGKDEGPAMMAHVGKAMGVSAPSEEESEEA